MIGVASSSINPTGKNHSSCGFFLHCNDGSLYAQDGTNGRRYTDACVAGTRVFVTLNCDNHTLTFGMNGKVLPIAFSALPSIELFPAFE